MNFSCKPGSHFKLVSYQMLVKKKLWTKEKKNWTGLDIFFILINYNMTVCNERFISSLYCDRLSHILFVVRPHTKSDNKGGKWSKSHLWQHYYLIILSVSDSLKAVKYNRLKWNSALARKRTAPKTYSLRNVEAVWIKESLGNLLWALLTIFKCFCCRPSSITTWTSRRHDAGYQKNTFHIPANINQSHMKWIYLIDDKPTTSNGASTMSKPVYQSLDVLTSLLWPHKHEVTFKTFYSIVLPASNFCRNIETAVMVQLNLTKYNRKHCCKWCLSGFYLSI